jgi:hypothetical protein
MLQSCIDYIYKYVFLRILSVCAFVGSGEEGELIYEAVNSWTRPNVELWLKSIRVEVVVIYFRYFPRISWEKMRKITKNSSEDSKCPIWDSNLAAPDPNSRLLPHDQLFWFLKIIYELLFISIVSSSMCDYRRGLDW